MRRWLAAFSLLALVPSGDAAEPVNLVVNAQHAGVQIKRDAVAAIFLRQGARWADGKLVRPVDQSTRSTVRAAFSEQVLGISMQAVQAHWMTAVAAGAAPPPVKGNDAEVIAFVASNPTAIGYVSAGTPLDDKVKTLKIVD